MLVNANEWKLKLASPVKKLSEWNFSVLASSLIYWQAFSWHTQESQKSLTFFITAEKSEKEISRSVTVTFSNWVKIRVKFHPRTPEAVRKLTQHSIVMISKDVLTRLAPSVIPRKLTFHTRHTKAFVKYGSVGA